MRTGPRDHITGGVGADEALGKGMDVNSTEFVENAAVVYIQG